MATFVIGLCVIVMAGFIAFVYFWDSGQRGGDPPGDSLSPSVQIVIEVVERDARSDEPDPPRES